MELKITKERVLEAASRCTTARETLKLLFPEVFSVSLLVSKDKSADELILANIGENTGISIAYGMSLPQYGQRTHFLLSSAFDWKIEERNGTKFLIPTKR